VAHQRRAGKGRAGRWWSLDREAGLLHEGGDLILGGPLFFGEAERGYAARFLIAYLAEVGDPALQSLAVYHALLPWP